MSSTGRSLVRNGLDQYDTPAWCTELVLPHVVDDATHYVLDPCAGVGAILDVAKRARPDIATVGFEIDSERAAECHRRGHGCSHADALATLVGWAMEPGTVVVTNPPYGIAEEMLRRCLSEVNTVAALLRLAFVAGQKRAAFWREYPADVFVLPKRPSFTGKGTDSCDYAWFVWGPGRGGRWSRLEVANAHQA